MDDLFLDAGEDEVALLRQDSLLFAAGSIEDNDDEMLARGLGFEAINMEDHDEDINVNVDVFARARGGSLGSAADFAPLPPVLPPVPNASAKRPRASSWNAPGTCPLPPRTALPSELALLASPVADPRNAIRVRTHPPSEVRTRTKAENRIFTCELDIVDSTARVASATVRLCYATDPSHTVHTLAGTLTRAAAGGRITFDDLSVSVASPKHGEREFMLEIAARVHRGAAAATETVYSNAFYAYSHRSVLKRRQEVSLRAVSPASVMSCGPSSANGCKMHVVGTPFVRSDRLQVALRVRRDAAAAAALELDAALEDVDGDWASLRAESVEWFSESVLFFEPPRALASAQLRSDLQVFLQVSNDGRNFSAPLEVAFLQDAAPARKRACPAAIRSRM